MSLYEDIRDGMKQALVLNELVDGLRGDVGQLSAAVVRLSDHVHDIDKRLVRIETMAELSLGHRLPDSGAAPE